MNFIKIDPWTRTVVVVAGDGSNGSFCNLIGCQFLDVSARQDNHDALLMDDGALDLYPQPPAFKFDGVGPLHGIAIIAGSDWDGRTTEPAFTVEQVTERITWLGSVHTRPALEWRPW